MASGPCPASGSRTIAPWCCPCPARRSPRLRAGIARFVGRDFVFGRGPTGFQAWSQSKRRLDRRLGFNQPWDLHDLRRSVQSRLAALGVGLDLINRLLNHAMGPIVEAYDRHAYTTEKGEALQRWADELERIIGRGAAKVIALHG